MAANKTRAATETGAVLLRVRHIYEHDREKFEEEVNEALRRIVADGGVVGDIKYASDPPGTKGLGGYGALIIYEVT